uniref:Uncharacterized protein n=1 Tax=Anguilla anguilla TaxID=7936 RepID=A0A0E9VS54_ANGAN
MSILPMGYKHV